MADYTTQPGRHAVYFVSGRTFDSYWAIKNRRNPSKPDTFTLSVEGQSPTQAKELARQHMYKMTKNMVIIDKCEIVPEALAAKNYKLPELAWGKPWYENRLVAFDVETTGLDAETGRIIEIGFAEYRPELRRFELATSLLLNNEGVAIESEARQAHGIEEAKLVDAPTFAQAFDEHVRPYLSQDVILLSHNRGFDLKHLLASMERANLLQDTYIPPCICSMEFAQLHDFGQGWVNKLGHLGSVLGVAGTNSHRAGDDATLCGDVFMTMSRRIASMRDLVTEQFLDLFDQNPDYKGI